MVWPPQIPDVNITETIDHMTAEEREDAEQLKPTEDLWQCDKFLRMLKKDNNCGGKSKTDNHQSDWTVAD